LFGVQQEKEKEKEKEEEEGFDTCFGL